MQVASCKHSPQSPPSISSLEGCRLGGPLLKPACTPRPPPQFQFHPPRPPFNPSIPHPQLAWPSTSHPFIHYALASVLQLQSPSSLFYFGICHCSLINPSIYSHSFVVDQVTSLPRLLFIILIQLPVDHLHRFVGLSYTTERQIHFSEIRF